MSIRAMTWAWGLAELPLRESMVLLALADAANDEGLCWPSQETLAVKSRSSLRSVKRTIKALTEAGLVEIVYRSSPEGRRTNLYRVIIGAEYSALDQQRANLALSDPPVDNPPVDNLGLPTESSKGPDWHLADADASLSATADTSLSATGGTLPPYREPKEEPPASHTPDSPEAGGLAGTTTETDGPTRPQGDAALPEIDHELLAACVPPPMVDWLAGPSAARVTAALRAALASGWTPDRLYRHLNADPVPADVRSRAGLVIHRVETICSSPPPAPAATPASRPRRQAERLPDPAEPTGPMPAEVREQLQELVARLRAKHAATSEKSDQHNKTERKAS